MNATDSLSTAREWFYNNRNELASAAIGTNGYAYAYDSIGNREWAVTNASTNAYSANALNQYAQVDSQATVYDACGNTIEKSGEKAEKRANTDLDRIAMRIKN